MLVRIFVTFASAAARILANGGRCEVRRCENVSNARPRQSGETKAAGGVDGETNIPLAVTPLLSAYKLSTSARWGTGGDDEDILSLK